MRGWGAPLAACRGGVGGSCEGLGLGFMGYGLGFRVWGLDLRAFQGVGFRFEG